MINSRVCHLALLNGGLVGNGWNRTFLPTSRSVSQIGCPHSDTPLYLRRPIRQWDRCYPDLLITGRALRSQHKPPSAMQGECRPGRERSFSSEYRPDHQSGR